MSSPNLSDSPESELDTELTPKKTGFMSRLKKTLTKEINFGGSDQQDTQEQSVETLSVTVSERSVVAETNEEPSEEHGFFNRLKQGLNRTRDNFTQGLQQLSFGSNGLDEAAIEELEMLLISADVGIDATTDLIEKLHTRIKKEKIRDHDTLLAALQADMQALLEPISQPLKLPAKSDKPYVILMIGMNGAGKTTTIGKMCKHFQAQGRSVMLAAGDTFRAAAVEQLKAWGDRNQVPVIAQHTGADSASVIYDALSAATARHSDVLLADTAGRLHTQDNLMAELQKIKRVMAKQDVDAPHEVMLILDASIGQNALTQAKQFHQVIGLDSISITKLDGTAKGGILFAVAKETGLPVRYIGVGEGVDDLREFNAADFVNALLAN